MISPPRNRVGTVADAVSRSDLLPRADSGAVLREHELRVVRCRYPLCPRRDCHPKGASAFGPPIRRIAPGKCHSATGDVHRFGARPSKTNNEPRALLAARGYWSLALFLREVVTMQRAYASRVGVFLRDFLSFFSRVAARSGAVVSCVHDLRLWSTRSQGLQLWWGAVRLSATRFRGRRVRFGASIFVREEKAHRRSVQTSQYPMFPMQSKIN